MQDEAIHRHLLVWVNQVKEHLGESPVPQLQPGFKSKPTMCVIANMFDADVAVGGTWLICPDGKKFRLPTYGSEFVSKFDKGKYPELVKQDLIERELQGMLK